MVQPNEKLKKIIIVTGVTGAVYVCFKYLLPLVIPFLFAYGIAVLLRPSAQWVSKASQVTIRGRRFKIPVGAAGGVELLLLLGLLGAGIYLGGRKLYGELGMLMDQIPVWIDGLDLWLTGICHNMELFFCLKEDCLVVLVRDMLLGLIASVKSTAMPYLMVNSMTIFGWFVKVTIVWVILMIGVILTLQEMDSLKARGRRSLFEAELRMIKRRLEVVCNAFVKTQGTIMLLTMTICTAGFWMLKNPYYVLGGISLGLLDALPIFGTGTVLIPWAIISFIRGRFAYGGALLAIYVICYFLREMIEAKMMGDKVGLSPLETLISMYVGLQLLGLLGFLLGPIGLLLIKDMVSCVESQAADRFP